MARVSVVPVLLAFAGVGALGGIAFAQDGLIVDPWDHDRSSWFESSAAPADGPAPRPALARSAASPLPRRDVAIEPWAVEPTELWVASQSKPNSAPKRPHSPPASSESLLATTARPAGPGWARPIREIVDPWSRRPGFVARDPLIVDPWSR